MTDLILERFDQLRDTQAINAYHIALQEGMSADEALQLAVRITRDRCRTPMQWANAPNAGFCPADVQPWLPVNPNYAEGINVADQEHDPDSMLNLYRRAIAVRQRTPALTRGEYQPLGEDEHVLVFLRHDPQTDQRCVVAINTAAEAKPVGVHGAAMHRGACLLSTHRAREGQSVDLAALYLEPFEAAVFEMLPE